MPRRALVLVVVVAAVLAGACQRPRIALEPVFDVHTDAGAVECSAVKDLGCVNFIKFQIAVEGALTAATECITVDQRLATLCDVKNLAHGTEIFRHDQDDRVQIKLWGLRVFPATSCEINPDCREKVLFRGASDWIKAMDVSGGKLPLHITEAFDCGLKEVYRPRGSRDCFTVCDGNDPVCDMADGCVCLVQPDAGVPVRAGNWDQVPADAGTD